MNDHAVLRATRFTVVRNGRYLLRDISFSARRGEVLGVIGPNGAGKTTLFECITGFVHPLNGELTSSDKVQRDETLFYLPDRVRPWPDQRVSWVLDFFETLFRDRVSDSVLEALQLAPLMRQRIGSLSKGEMKRLLLALSLGSPHPVLLLDEPFDGLDFKQTRRAMELLRGSAAEGRTLIVSIHQLSDAARVCDRFLLLDHGHAIAEGSLDELRERTSLAGATLEEVFLALE